MDISFVRFGFYNVRREYMKVLNQTDPEVFYSEDKAYERKPFLGILVAIGKYNYMLPLTSAKPKHAAWKLSDKTYNTIYEIICSGTEKKTDVIKRIPGDESHVYRILAVLDIKKMIPVPESQYSYVNFDQEEDKKYVGLMRKEFDFCQNIQNEILAKASAIYEQQRLSGKVFKFHCNYSELEKVCDNFDVQPAS